MARPVSLLEAALVYAGFGWHIFPLHTAIPGQPPRCTCGDPDCTSIGKHPREKGWRQSATTQEAVIRRWWGQYPEANIGLACGPDSGLWVLDVDFRHGGYESLQSLWDEHAEENDWPTTIKQTTGSSSWHYFFRWAEGVPNSVGAFRPGLDTRAAGGLVVLPPSMHESGRRYEWTKGAKPKTTPLADAPGWLLELVRAKAVKPAAPAVAGAIIPQGNRDDRLTGDAGAMRRRGMEEPEIAVALLEINARRCVPPLPEEQVRKIAHSVSRYQPADLVSASRNGTVPPEAAPSKDAVLDDDPGEEWTDAELIAMDLPEARFVVPGYLPEGLTVLAGGQKFGKSWMALGIAAAVASGGKAFGEIDVDPGGVLYLALEDTPKRIKKRLRAFLGDHARGSGRVRFRCRWPRVDAGGLVKLREWLEAHPETRLVIIDVLACFRSANGRNGDVYQADMDFGHALKRVADDFGIALLVLHHISKRSCDDPFDAVSGTIGVTGAADTTLLLRRKRGEKSARLFITGRDIEEEREMALEWNPHAAGWVLAGTAEEYSQSAERKQIIALVRESGAMGPAQVAVQLKKNSSTVRTMMSKLCTLGLLHSDGRLYWAPIESP